MWRPLTWTVCWLGVLLVLGQPARAGAEDAESLVRKGIELRRSGDDQQALEMFRRAAAIEKTPRVLAQLGLAEQAVGQWVSAEVDLQAALAATSDRWIVKNHAALTDALNTVQAHVGSIEVWGTPAGAEVLVDGAVVGKLGTLPASGRVRLPVGRATLLVRHPGYAEASRTVDVRQGDVSRENIDLHAVSVEPPPATDQRAANPAPQLLATDTAAGQGGDAAQADDHPFYKRWWFWTLVGAAVAGGAASIYLVSHGGSSGLGCDQGVNCGTWTAALLQAPSTR